jgi:hypothetical protein
VGRGRRGSAGIPTYEGVQTAHQAQRKRVATSIGAPWPLEHTLPSVGRAVEDACQSLAEAAGKR